MLKISTETWAPPEHLDDRQLVIGKFDDQDAWEQLHFVAGKEI